MTRMSKNPVGRPRGFDEDQVLDEAMKVFWRNGYENTTLEELLAATGLHKGSLYQAFGDKHTLFVRALQRYTHILFQEVGSLVLSAPTALEGMRAAMRKAVTMHGEEDCGPGCMALNTLVEKAPHDEEVMAILQNALARRNNMITQAVKACQQEGSLRGDWEAPRITAMIEALEGGLAVAMRGGLSAEQAFIVIDDLMASLQPAEKAA